MASGLLSIISVSGAGPNWILEVTNSGGVSAGDHIAAPLSGLPIGRGGVYRVDNVISSSLIEVFDDLEPSGGTYGEPGAGGAQFYTPTEKFGMSQCHNDGPHWGPALRRDLFLADDNMGSAGFSRTTEDMIWEVDYVNGVTPEEGTIITSQAEYDALGAPLKYMQDVETVRPLYIDHCIVVNMVAGSHYAPPGNMLTTQEQIFIAKKPSFISDKVRAFNSGKHTTERYPGIVFRGERNVLETNQVTMSLSTTTGYYTLTRTAGNPWPADLLGKFITFTSGVNVGKDVTIIERIDDDYLLIRPNTLNTSGSFDIEIWECSSILEDEVQPGGGVAAGIRTISSWPEYNTGGTAIWRFHQLVSESAPQLRTSALYSCYIKGLCQVIGNINIFTSCFSSSILMSSTTLERAYIYVADSFFFGTVPTTHFDVQHGMVQFAGTVFKVTADKTAVRVSGPSYIFVNNTVIQGAGGAEVGITTSDYNLAAILPQISNLWVHNCDYIFSINGTNFISRWIQGQNNNYIAKVTKGSRFLLQYNANLPVPIVDIATIDGSDYDSTVLGVAGDEVTGQYGSSMLITE